MRALILHFLFCATCFAEYGNPLRPNSSGQAFSGNVVFRAAAIASPSSSTFLAVGRAWNGSNYSAILKSLLVTNYGFPDGSFKKSGGWNPGEQLYDFAGAGLDNLCAAVTYAYDGYIAACRSMMANGHYNVYLIKVDASGNLNSSFGTGGIVNTGLGTSSVHALVRAITYNADVNTAHHGVVAIAGATGSYAPGNFTPFLQVFDQQTGAAYTISLTPTSIQGTAVALTYDHSSAAYYVASTETATPNHFYVAKYFHDGSYPTLLDTSVGWNNAVDFTQAISGGAAHSIPTSIAVSGSDVLVAGSNKVSAASTPWRCAVVAFQTSNGSLDTSFGKVSLSGGTNSTGITLFSHEVSPAHDCILNSLSTSGTNLLLTGSAYTAANSNYDYLAALIDSSGAFAATFGTGAVAGTEVFGLGPSDDVINASVLVNSGSNLVTVGRSSDSSGYQGADAQYFNVSTGSVTPLLSSLYAVAPAVSHTGTTNLTITARFIDGSSVSVPSTSFNVSANSVFTVNSDDSITAQSAGAGQITIRIGGLSFTLNLNPYIALQNVAGGGSGGTLNYGFSFGPTNVPGTTSMLVEPYGVAVDSAGNLYIADTSACTIHMIPKTTGAYFGQSMTAGYLYTLAGAAYGSAGTSGDGGLASNSLLTYPNGISVDSAGNVYIADTAANRIQFIPKTSGTFFGQSMSANYIYTIAGSSSGSSGSSGNSGLATSALLSSPSTISTDSSGNLYIADTGNHRIQMVPKTSGTYFGQSMTANFIYTIAGTTGTNGSTGNGGLASSALLNSPFGVSLDSIGNLYIGDSGNNRVQMVPKTTAMYFGQSMTANYVYTIAGNSSGSSGTSGNGGSATSALLSNPNTVSVDSSGNVYILDSGNNRLQMVAKTSGTYFGQSMTANQVYTLAGDSSGGSGTVGDGGPASSAFLFLPQAASVDSAGNLYIADMLNSRVQMVPKTSGAYFGQSMTANYMYTVAGALSAPQGTSGNGGVATSSLFYYPAGVSSDSSGNLYVADTYNNRIQMVPKTSGTYFGQSMTANYIYTVAGSSVGGQGTTGNGSLATSALLRSPGQVVADSSGNLYIADTNNSRIQMVPITSGTYFGQSMTASYVYTIAGSSTGGTGSSGNGGIATSALLAYPRSVTIDSSGNAYIADSDNSRILMVPKASGTYFGQSMTASYAYTIAGSSAGLHGNSADGAAATSSYISSPWGIAVDGSGNLFFADVNNSKVQMVPQTSGTYFGQSMIAYYLYTVAGSSAGSEGISGAGGPATSALLYSPRGIALDGSGNLYIADTNNDRILFVPKTTGTYFAQSMSANYVYAIAGDVNGAAGYASIDSSGNYSLLDAPDGVSVSSSGTVYIADTSNNVVRVLVP